MRKTQNILYGFVDESGSAGVKTKDEDYLIISLVLFTEKEKKKIRPTFVDLRQKLKLKKDYEFHYSRNKQSVRAVVFEELKKFEFRFYTFAIRKDNMKRHASYFNLAEKLINIPKNNLGVEYIITIDRNPILLKNLNEVKKKYQIKNIKFTEGDSARDDKLQLVDYVVGIHSKIIRGQKEPGFELIRTKLAKMEIIIYN